MDILENYIVREFGSCNNMQIEFCRPNLQKPVQHSLRLVLRNPSTKFAIIRAAVQHVLKIWWKYDFQVVMHR